MSHEWLGIPCRYFLLVPMFIVEMCVLVFLLRMYAEIRCERRKHERQNDEKSPND